MFNPFVNRSIEQIRDETAFLSVVTPAPLDDYLKDAGEELYTKLVQIVGPPGTGKTTLARLFEFPIIAALLRHPEVDGYKETLKVLIACNAIGEGDRPLVLGYRLGLEGQYRQIWELPYREDLRNGLLQSLIQARAMQGWLRGLQAAAVNLSHVVIRPRSDGETLLSTIGGAQAVEVLKRASQVEQAVYELTAALDPPVEAELDLVDIGAYRPFDLVQNVMIPWGGTLIALQPLLLLDDTSKLHPNQYRAVERWLVRREMRIARWMLGWGDRLPLDVLISGNSPSGNEHPGLTQGRDRKLITMGRDGIGDDDRGVARRRFRRMAMAMADRYLARMTIFVERKIQKIQLLLPDLRSDAPAGVLDDLEKRLKVEARNAKISAGTLNSLRTEVDSYAKGAKDPITGDERLAMTRILLHRHAIKTPQRSLFETPTDDVETATEPAMRVGAHLAEGARVHLLHEHKRPLYYGIKTLCDAASMNVEQFLFLCSPLVDQAETRIVRGRSPELDVVRQHELLRARAKDALEQHWRFPHAEDVRRLGHGIAKRCLKRSLERNAPLGSGANALGVLQADFDQLMATNERLRQVLHAALAHNAFSLVPNYDCKRKKWMLLQLNGLLIMHHGLSLRWGGFVEAPAHELIELLAEEP